AVARELTKVHDEFVRGTLPELAERFREEPRGEITLLVEGAPEAAVAPTSDEALLAEIARRLQTGETSIKQIAAELAELTGRPRREIYALALRAKEG
ncbi:MAG: 16S rRNA (cytidine(1402)-2'-O)-methyltransferase, partial [Myxococcales bacterium]